jgi:cytochrome d ubiquinol oxidase subunit II
LTLYVLLGGADFGAGIWEVNLAFQASEKERTQLQRAIGPVWDCRTPPDFSGIQTIN